MLFPALIQSTYRFCLLRVPVKQLFSNRNAPMHSTIPRLVWTTTVYAITFLTVGMVGCSNPNNTATRKNGTRTSNDGKLRIAVIPKGTSHQFWRSVHAGAEAAAKEVGDVEILWKGPETEADTAGQISVVKNFVTSEVDGIVLAPNHSQALVDVVEEAIAEKIPGRGVRQRTSTWTGYYELRGH